MIIIPEYRNIEPKSSLQLIQEVHCENEKFSRVLYKNFSRLIICTRSITVNLDIVKQYETKYEAKLSSWLEALHGITLKTNNSIKIPESIGEWVNKGSRKEEKSHIERMNGILTKN